MTRTALILAAHGSRRDDEPCDLVRELARRIDQLRLFSQVIAAFHAGTPGFADALVQTIAPFVTVVPIMTSQGYYTEFVIPREFARCRRHPSLHLHITPPIGVHPRMPALIESQALRLAARFNVPPSQSALALIGHGTPKHPASRRATESLADALIRRNCFAAVQAFFLDEPPSVESIPTALPNRELLIIPFLIAPGRHVREDIPRRLGLFVPSAPIKPSSSFPFEAARDNRRILCDDAIGANPAILDLILDAALTADPARIPARHALSSEAAN